jgi:hypothetical protein
MTEIKTVTKVEITIQKDGQITEEGKLLGVMAAIILAQSSNTKGNVGAAVDGATNLLQSVMSKTTV